MKLLGACAIGLELVLGGLAGPAALVAVLIVFAFSLLMLKEFFVAQWLRRHFLIYVSSHMLVMPLLALVIFSFSTGRYPWQAPGWYWLYSFVGFFVAFNWEVSRKIRRRKKKSTTWIRTPSSAALTVRPTWCWPSAWSIPDW